MAASPHPKPTAQMGYFPSVGSIYETCKIMCLGKLKSRFACSGDSKDHRYKTALSGYKTESETLTDFYEFVFSAAKADFFGVL
jgi:hypothetical protein